MEIAVLIPAHKESARIAETVRAALDIQGVTKVVVVDDGSGDDTADIAEDAGAKVVRLVFNVGKGAALEAGASRVENADVVLMLDGDLADTASQGVLLLEPVIGGTADMAVARFPRPTGKAGLGFVKGLARAGITLLGGRGFTPDAPLSGQRAMTRECFFAVRPFATGYGVEVALAVRAMRAGMRIVEVDTTMTHDATGRDIAGFVHRGRQFVHVSLALIKLAFERRRRPR